MKKINYKSDFDFILRLRDCEGGEIGWPDYDWTAKFWTSSKANMFVASCINGVAVNCRNDNGQIHIVANSHGLGVGQLNVEFTAELPSGVYPDDAERIVVPLPLEIELIRGAAPCPEGFEVEMILPYIKGEPFTYEDFTEEQLEDLRLPATEAASDARAAASDARAAAVETVEATADAVQGALSANDAADRARSAAAEAAETNDMIAAAEDERRTAENGRAAAESGRVTAESARASAETARVTAEDGRAAAETARDTAESERTAAENARKDAERERATAEEGRVSAENARTSNETARESNETARVNAEAGRTTAEAARVKAESDRANEFSTFTDQIAAKVDMTVYDEAQNKQDARISNLEEYVIGNSANPELFRKAKDVAVGAWNHVDLNPDATDFYGNKEFANCWHFALIDCDAAANEDGTQPIVGELKRNNLLRFADGSFAPTVGITEAMRAECDVELYLDAAHTQKWCDAGAFDAEAFYTEHGMAKLYNADGTEVRVLRPWETTETKYSIFLASDKTLYPIDRLVGESGTEWSGVMAKPLKWDGLDVGEFALAPTGITPSAFCTVNDKARCFFFDYEADHNNCRSANGYNNIITMFRNGRTYPRVNDINQSSAGTKARLNNSDPAASFPFAEGGTHARNVYNLCLEAKYGTKNLNRASQWGTGISSNDTCRSEEEWLTNGGVRCKIVGDADYSYQSFNQQPNLCYNTSGAKTNWTNWLNYEYPKEQCMEAQMAMSFANERGIAEGEHFDFYGGEYWYYDVPGIDRSYMSARVYKIMSQHDCEGAFDANGSPITFDVDVILRMSLYDGATLSGDIYSYDNGGCYLIGKYNGTNANSEIRTYLEPDQRKWGAVQTVLHGDADYHWLFEDTYKYLGLHVASGNAYMKQRQSWSTGKLANGGNVNLGECAYNYDSCYWASGAQNIGRLFLVGVRSRLYANHTFCSRRSVFCIYGHGHTYRNSCASAQVLLPSGWRSRGATPRQGLVQRSNLAPP